MSMTVQQHVHEFWEGEREFMDILKVETHSNIHPDSIYADFCTQFINHKVAVKTSWSKLVKLKSVSV